MSAHFSLALTQIPPIVLWANMTNESLVRRLTSMRKTEGVLNPIKENRLLIPEPLLRPDLNTADLKVCARGDLGVHWVKCDSPMDLESSVFPCTKRHNAALVST